MKIFWIVFTVVISSFFYFPFEFTFLPKGFNTKIMIAIAGLPLMAYHMIVLHGFKFSRELAISSMIALVFSIIGYYSVDYNHSDDYSYATYISSMWIWFLASYTVVTLIGYVHSYLSVRLVVNYLIAVCIIQCALAILIDLVPAVKQVIDTYFFTTDLKFLEKTERLYGIGAALDVAGLRFGAVLIMIAVLLSTDTQIRHSQKIIFIYFICFLLIGAIGNMISRTTSVGMIIGVVYLIYALNLIKTEVSIAEFRIWKIILFSVLIIVGLAVYFYNTNKEVHELLRFGFEGFFNWVEKGKWYTDSTDKLNKEMWIWPQAGEIKTWLIGNAVFSEWHIVGTDIGYCRFVFYCGLTGLSVFILFFIYLSYSLYYRFQSVKNLFLLLLILTLINWIKVSTDTFLIYALFLSLSSPYLYQKFYKESTQNENSI
ncbi:hypothetical protein ACR79T_18225 [Sphingobacterium spiritivorum]|uniref:hypothetical protein n=1 Tax=Sphingobacterium spiritivorum TaxID=258 RepID=UPI003DA38E70